MLFAKRKIWLRRHLSCHVRMLNVFRNSESECSLNASNEIKIEKKTERERQQEVAKQSVIDLFEFLVAHLVHERLKLTTTVKMSVFINSLLAYNE